MLFQNIHDIQDTQTKKQHLEKINIMTRIVEEYCSLIEHSLSDYDLNTDKATVELFEIGLISSVEDLPVLKKLVGKDYNALLTALSFYHDHKEETHYLLKKFYPTYRLKKQMEASEDNESPRIADFLLTHIRNLKEDKLIGPFYIKKSTLEGNEENFQKVFKNKLLMYLSEDVLKTNNKLLLFKEASFSKIIKLFDDEKNVFSEDFTKLLQSNANGD